MTNEFPENVKAIVESRLLDHKEGVTYKWLSHEIGVSSSRAQQILWAYSNAFRGSENDGKCKKWHKPLGKWPREGNPTSNNID